jgi:NADPH2:quinone reductase
MQWVLSDKYGSSFDDAIERLTWKPLPRAPLSSPTDVRIAVRATALNFFDLLALCDKYQVKYPLPMSPCSEMCGVVTETGANVTRLRVGDTVLVAFGANACRSEVVVDESIVFLAPPHLTPVEASAMFVGYATAFHGLVQRGNVQKGECVLITGAAGGMGIFAIEVARECGAGEIVCTVSTEEKKRICLEHGATSVIVLAKDEKQWQRQLREALPNGCDVCYEICGGTLFDCASRLMRSYGRLLVIGFASGTIASLKSNLPLIKGYSVVGVRSGAELLIKPELMKETMEAMHRSRIRPRVQVFPAAEGKQAFRQLADKKAIGKLVIDFSNVSAKL